MRRKIAVVQVVFSYCVTAIFALTSPCFFLTELEIKIIMEQPEVPGAILIFGSRREWR